jgi:hypothetical protein
MAAVELPPIDCPVVGCTGIERDHRGLSPWNNLHRRPGIEWPLPTLVEWPLSVEIVMDSTTWPFWKLNPEMWPVREMVTAEEALYAAAVLNMNALHLIEINPLWRAI